MTKENVEKRLVKIREILYELITLNGLHLEFSNYVNKLIMAQLMIDAVFLIWLIILTSR